MAELCIVCLGELRASLPAEPPDSADLSSHEKILPDSTAAATSIDDDDEAIAQLLPCRHDLHHTCLKPWVERANSCPICRATFNMVELSRTVAGPVVGSYAVQDKVQEAEIDPTMITEDELFSIETWEPCLVCGSPDDGHGSMYCDGCDHPVHVFCAGFHDAPEIWYCESCMFDLDRDMRVPRRTSAGRRTTAGRRPRTQQRNRRQNPDAVWARVWQEVSRRLDLDLDFPFDEEPHDQRTEEQRREFARWQRRFEVANRQGASDRLREIATTQLQSSAPQVDPESQEELKAWNAFEKARESSDAPQSVRRRKRKATASPASPAEPDLIEQPQQKRPRLRRPITRLQTSTPPVAESSNAAAQRGKDEPTFLTSLLNEVKTTGFPSGSPDPLETHLAQHNDGMSPMFSPSSSSCGTPRGQSPQRPLSPPLSSSSAPVSPSQGATFSPFSPVVKSPHSIRAHMLQHRGRRRPPVESPSSGDERAQTIDRASSMSPSRLSYSAKQEVQRMVKAALGSRYRDKEITKEQYTDVNRDVSRKLYDLIGEVSALSDQSERERWQSIADDEVRKAVAVLRTAVSPPSE